MITTRLPLQSVALWSSELEWNTLEPANGSAHSGMSGQRPVARISDRDV